MHMKSVSHSPEKRRIGHLLNAQIRGNGQHDFKWNLNFNFTYVKNEIKSLTTDGVLLSAYSDLAPTHILQVGQPIGSFWGIKYLGIDPAPAAIARELSAEASGHRYSG